MITIDKAIRDDLPGILDLVKGLATFEKAADEVTVTIDDYYRAFDEGLIECQVAKKEGQIIGMVLYYMTFSTWKGHMLYLEDFFVLPRFRSEGLGQKLFDRFIDAAKQKGCALTKWQVLDWNHRAIQFYKRNGAVIEKEWWNGKIFLDNG